MQNSTNQKKATVQTVIFKKTVRSDAFVKYEHSINPENAKKYLKKYNGSNLAFWAFGASIFGHKEEAIKNANLIKGGRY